MNKLCLNLDETCSARCNYPKSCVVSFIVAALIVPWIVALILLKSYIESQNIK